MKSLCLILFLALSATPSCSLMTAKGRQDRAYAKYFKKIRVDRERRIAKLHHDRAPKIPKPETMVPSEPFETVQAMEGPQSVRGDSSGH